MFAKFELVFTALDLTVRHIHPNEPASARQVDVPLKYLIICPLPFHCPFPAHPCLKHGKYTRCLKLTSASQRETAILASPHSYSHSRTIKICLLLRSHIGRQLRSPYA